MKKANVTWSTLSRSSSDKILVAEFHLLNFVGWLYLAVQDHSRVCLCTWIRRDCNNFTMIDFVRFRWFFALLANPVGLPTLGKPGVGIVNLDVCFTGCEWGREYRLQILTPLLMPWCLNGTFHHQAFQQIGITLYHILSLFQPGRHHVFKETCWGWSQRALKMEMLGFPQQFHVLWQVFVDEWTCIACRNCQRLRGQLFWCSPVWLRVLTQYSTHFRVVSIWNPKHQQFIINKYTYTSAYIPEVMGNLAGHPAKLWGNHFYVNTSNDNLIFKKPHWLVRYLEILYYPII